MKSMDDLIGYLALNTEPGEEIIVGVFRDGEEIAIPMTLGHVQPHLNVLTHLWIAMHISLWERVIVMPRRVLQH
ncbi:MAG: hypothetical protein CM1200mP39_18490 [Dehalococcoidia bacterium]|nr:MAG: hypothetical protein CM1200mP39_18490 [Dehalococcoidia bacterium]